MYNSYSYIARSWLSNVIHFTDENSLAMQSLNGISLQIPSAKLSYETSLVTFNNCNKIYKYITSLSKKSSIPTCMHYGSKLSQSSSEIVYIAIQWLAISIQPI